LSTTASPSIKQLSDKIPEVTKRICISAKFMPGVVVNLNQSIMTMMTMLMMTIHS
jgi:hypothetical protein